MVHLDVLWYSDAVPYQDVLPYHDTVLHHNTLPYYHIVQHYYAIQQYQDVSGWYTLSFILTNCQSWNPTPTPSTPTLTTSHALTRTPSTLCTPTPPTQHTPPTPHAAAPRIQVSNSLYFTLYFTLHGDTPLTRHGIRTLRTTSTCRTAPSRQTASVYCILVIELLLLKYSVSILYLFFLYVYFHGFAVKQLQCRARTTQVQFFENKISSNLLIIFITIFSRSARVKLCQWLKNEQHHNNRNERIEFSIKSLGGTVCLANRVITGMYATGDGGVD